MTGAPPGQGTGSRGRGTGTRDGRGTDTPFAARRLRSLAAGTLRNAPMATARRQVPGGPGDHAQEHCDLCSAPLEAGHRHLVTADTAALMCACRACSLLFEQTDDGHHRFRLVPVERTPLTGPALPEHVWAGLSVPVDLAFFTVSGASGGVTAAYPSPLGLMRSEVAPGSWARVTGCLPALVTLRPDVSALLVDRVHSPHRYWLVPVDDCYRLAALVRAHWKGLNGGPEVWQRVDGFFGALATDSVHQPEEASWVSP
ncbi:DUF5947 family protein [Streptomyces sp. NPDC051018]|uniref:DUF5947 family protein n=1 Tax=Streptomyces sp. NPDC051018 TaxID=3365639 RepID=UPI00378F9D60